ncbi:hypothetical protein KGO5_05361 [Sinorhizobium sp. KGO-5]|nr:hypothetical protein KGO5_05361 [Sinorhizobium sp. KGO-5]
MTVFRKTVLVGALLLAAPSFAEESHHPKGTQSEPAAAAQPSGGSSSDMMPGGMMHEGMMRMMMGMMSGGDRPMDTPMQQMMSPEHIEGRIAFLRTELKVTETQQPLWEAVADALRARAQTAKDVMDGMPGAMMSGSSAPLPLPQRIELYERMLSSRLDGLRQLKVALEPFYAALDDTQKAAADKLLVPAPMGMM